MGKKIARLSSACLRRQGLRSGLDLLDGVTVDHIELFALPSGKLPRCRSFALSPARCHRANAASALDEQFGCRSIARTGRQRVSTRVQAL